MYIITQKKYLDREVSSWFILNAVNENDTEAAL